MAKQESRLQRERQVHKVRGFIEGIDCTKEIITNELKDAIENGLIVIEKGADKLFEIIQSVGNIS